MKQLCSGIIGSLWLLTTLGACEKGAPSPEEQAVSVTIKANEKYSYSLGNFGDEEGALITRQATHYQISTLIRDAGFSTFTYNYQPVLNYVGTDEVTIKSARGTGGGGGGNDKIINTTIRIKITK